MCWIDSNQSNTAKPVVQCLHRPRTEGSWIHCSTNREGDVIKREAPVLLSNQREAGETRDEQTNGRFEISHRIGPLKPPE
jgi:hypothetical protein